MSSAAEVRVLSAGAMQPGLIAITAAFREETGREIKVTYAIAPELHERVRGGEAADVLIAPLRIITDLVKAGRADAGNKVDLGRVGAGVVVRDGAPLPDISGANALKRSLVDADSVVFNRASSGIYIEKMLKELGVFDQIQRRVVRYPDGTAVMHHLMKGRGKEFGFGGITDILLYCDKGLKLVGPLPEEIQNYTSYTAAIVSATTNADGAKALIRYLATPAARSLIAAAGINPN